MTLYAVLALLVFVAAYTLVLAEDLTKLRKSKPLILANGLIWILAALQADREAVAAGMKECVYEFGQLFLFVLVAMTYISALRSRGVFDWISARLLVKRGGSRRAFWVTGCLAFVLSPVADNMTTALVLGAVVCTSGQGRPRFLALALTNVVVAANAGGAFSPFGDLTTLMTWQAQKVPTLQFAWLILPALISWLLPAMAMQLALVEEELDPAAQTHVAPARDWANVTALFLATIVTALLFHAVFHLPPFMGMTTGLGYYMLYCYWDCRRRGDDLHPGSRVFEHVKSVEWDTMLFFFGVILCLGGLEQLGLMQSAASLLYDGLGPVQASTLVGLLSAILDNVPVMFAVLGMDPDMGVDNWLLVTLTAGIGGSLLSIGSAAGVALMGTSGGAYTITRHLVWTPVILVGYAAGIALHLWIVSAGLIPG